MPKDTRPLGNIRLLRSQPTITDRMRVLSGMLCKYSLDVAKPKFKGITNCCKWVNDYQRPSQVVIEGVGGKVKTYGLKTCGSYDCPNCSGYVRKQEADKVSKSVKACLWDGGEVRFITATKAPEIADVKSIEQVQTYKSKAIKLINNYNKNNGTKIGIWITIETTISSKAMVEDHYGTSCKPKLYLHVHTHGLLTLTNQDSIHVKLIESRLKSLWREVVVSLDGKTFAGGGDKYLEEKGFRSDVINESNGIGEYLNKLMNPLDNIGLETTMGQVKGDNKSGRGLMIAIDRMMDRDCSDWEYREIRRLVETWFVGMYRKNRMNRNQHFKDLVQRFETIRYGIVEDYWKRNFGNLVYLEKLRFFGDRTDYDGKVTKVLWDRSEDKKFAEQYVEEAYERLAGGLEVDGYCFPLHSFEREKIDHQPAPDWIEVISGRLWDEMTRRGHFGLIVDILVGYHYRNENKHLYDALMYLSDGCRGMGISDKMVWQGIDLLVLRCYEDHIL